MKKFKIPVSWVMSGEITIHAETLKEACTKTRIYSELGLKPFNGSYVENSFVIDEEYIANSVPKSFEVE